MATFNRQNEARRKRRLLQPKKNPGDHLIWSWFHGFPKYPCVLEMIGHPGDARLKIHESNSCSNQWSTVRPYSILFLLCHERIHWPEPRSHKAPEVSDALKEAWPPWLGWNIVARRISSSSCRQHEIYFVSDVQVDKCLFASRQDMIPIFSIYGIFSLRHKLMVYKCMVCIVKYTIL